MSTRLYAFVCVILFTDICALVNCYSFRDALPVNCRPAWYQTNSEYFATLINTPFSPMAYASGSSYFDQVYGMSAIMDVVTDQACRLNSKPCMTNNDCCSRFCRCVKWSTIGPDQCWRKCL